MFKTIVILCAMMPTLASAGSHFGKYCTTISDQDRISSKGVRLTTVAQIIQNDRANYYSNRHRDSGDEDSGRFDTVEDRNFLASIIKPRSTGPLLTDELVLYGGDVPICIRYDGGDFEDPYMQLEIVRSDL